MIFDILIMAGAGCIVVAAWQIYPPAGLGALGVFLLYTGIMGAKKWPSSPDS